MAACRHFRNIHKSPFHRKNNLLVWISHPEGGIKSFQPGISLKRSKKSPSLWIIPPKTRTRRHHMKLPLPGILSHIPSPSSRVPSRQKWNIQSETDPWRLLSWLGYLGEEVVEDLVIGEDRVQRYAEQKVFQSNPATLHKVWVHFVGGQLVPHKLSLHTNTSTALMQSFIYTDWALGQILYYL